VLQKKHLEQGEHRTAKGEQGVSAGDPRCVCEDDFERIKRVFERLFDFHFAGSPNLNQQKNDMLFIYLNISGEFVNKIRGRSHFRTEVLSLGIPEGIVSAVRILNQFLMGPELNQTAVIEHGYLIAKSTG
jgi:hypothetical protein